MLVTLQDFKENFLYLDRLAYSKKTPVIRMGYLEKVMNGRLQYLNGTKNFMIPTKECFREMSLLMEL